MPRPHPTHRNPHHQLGRRPRLPPQPPPPRPTPLHLPTRMGNRTSRSHHMTSTEKRHNRVSQPGSLYPIRNTGPVFGELSLQTGQRPVAGLYPEPLGPSLQRTCVHHGCDEPPAPPRRTRGRRPTLCPEHQGRSNAKPRVIRPTIACHICGKTFAQKRRTHRYCSTRCGEIASGNLRPGPLPQRTCALDGCDIVFVPQADRQRCCCEQHGKRHYNQRSRANGRRKEAWTDARRNAYHRRRTLKRTNAGDPVVFNDIAARDHWRCGICHQRIKPTTKWPDPLSPSLDHILPLNAGGSHDPANVRIAHLICNTRRSDNYGGEPLMLFG